LKDGGCLEDDEDGPGEDGDALGEDGEGLEDEDPGLRNDGSGLGDGDGWKAVGWVLLVDLEPSTTRRSSSRSSTPSTHFKNSRHPHMLTDLLQQKHTQILKVAVWFPRK